MDNIYNGQKIHVTVEWMAKKYEEMNQQLFGGALGACRFKVFTTCKGSKVKNYEYQVLYRGNMLENKKTEKIVENVINRFLSEELGLVSDENFISINPDMNLGEESPLELA